MSLDEYARKRRFENTPEPGVKPAVAAGLTRSGSFCVQRHQARQLHYDFRLEISGVLKSWAIPKGPTLDPSAKHFAAAVEDHPLEYGDFEGNIPAGNYGAGSVMLWDRGTFEVLGEPAAEAQIERGDFKFRLAGQKLNGEFALVRMKGAASKGIEWLLLKKKDAFADPDFNLDALARSIATGRTQEEIAGDLPVGRAAPAFDPPAGAIASPMPAAAAPMLAQAAVTPPSGDEWLAEVKWDGVRALCFIEDGKVRLISRNRNAMERQYPELAALAHLVNARSAILDGEIVCLDPNGLPSFGLLQRRITVGDASSIANLARTLPVVFYAFDVLYADGFDLRPAALADRKRVLTALIRPGGALRYSDHFPGKAAALLALAREKNLEGIVVKRATSPYEPKRSADWLKVKVNAQQEFVIGGYTVGEREYFSSLALGVYSGAKLEFVGNVGSGFDQGLLEDLFHRMQPLVTPECPFDPVPKMPRATVWLRPELVCEVKYASWTHEEHLRAPVFLGMRTDLPARECVRESERGEQPEATDERPPLIANQSNELQIEVDGRRLKLTNLNKVFYPKEGYVKRDLLNYYDAVADLIIPYLADRPLSLKRYPDGIEGEWFFQKAAASSFPDWLRTEPIAYRDDKEPTRFVIADDRATLLFLVNLGCIDQNPGMSRVTSLENPDFLLIDLDPYECSYDKIVEAALLARKTLTRLGLEGYPKTTGGNGMHIYVPVEPVYTFEQARTFTELIARLVIAERPDLFTTPRSVGKREPGRVYFDYLQIGTGKTISAPYVLRAHAGAPVATPLAWREVAPGLNPKQFHIRNAVDRFRRVGDLFRGVLTNRQRLEPAIEKMGRLLSGKQGA